MRRGFLDVQFGVDARVAQLAVHSHGVGQEQVARPGGQERGREALGEIAEQRRQIGVREIVTGCVEQVGLHQAAHRIEPDVGLVAVTRFGEVRLDDGRVVKVGAFPISIDSAELDRTARNRDIRKRAKQIRAELGAPRKILLGVDRLDYTKGIDVRLKAFSELLAEGRANRDDTVMVQLATTSRERVDSYRVLRNEIEQQVGHINGEYAEVGHPVVHYLHRPIPRDELLAFFVASDVMLVTPLRDGMNLVAKEYVACRSDLGGALVLSEFTGAAAELRQAYLTNPHDLEGVKDAIEAALNQDPEDGRRRMRAMRRQVLTHDVDGWARAFLSALAATKAN